MFFKFFSRIPLGIADVLVNQISSPFFLSTNPIYTLMKIV